MSEETVVAQADTPTQADQEASVSLAAGYNKVKGADAAPKVDAPAAETTEAQTADDKPAATDAPAAATPDEWEGVSPIIRSTLEGITKNLSKLDAIEHDLKSTVGRVGALQRSLDAASKVATKAGADAPTQGQVAAAAQASDSWKKLKEDFPEWASALDERLASEGKAIRDAMPKVDTDALYKGVDERLNPKLAAIKAEVRAEARALARLDMKHEGWEEKINTPQYAAWIKTQAPEVQALADSDKVNDASRLLDLFDEHAKAEAAKAKNKARLATVVTPKQASSGGPSILPDEAGLSVGYNRIKRA